MFTRGVIDKLEYAFSIDCNVREACLYAGISTTAYYSNVTEDFSTRAESLRQEAVIKARGTIFKSLDNYKVAQWYLERKHKSAWQIRHDTWGLDMDDL